MSKRGPSPSTLSDRINALEMRMARLEVDAEHRAQDLAALDARVAKDRLAVEGRLADLLVEISQLRQAGLSKNASAPEQSRPWWRQGFRL